MALSVAGRAWIAHSRNSVPNDMISASRMPREALTPPGGTSSRKAQSNASPKSVFTSSGKRPIASRDQRASDMLSLYQPGGDQRQRRRRHDGRCDPAHDTQRRRQGESALILAFAVLIILN